MNEEIPTIAVAHGPKQSRRQDRKGNPTTAKWSHRAKSNRTETWKTEAATAMYKVPECRITKGDSLVSFLQTCEEAHQSCRAEGQNIFFKKIF